MNDSDAVPDKFAIARALEELAALLELEGGKSLFRAKAYRRGARALVAVSEDVADLVREGRLTSVPGIGAGIAAAIEQLSTTGRFKTLERLRAEMPPGAAELARVEGLSLDRIRRLHDALGVRSIDELRAAAEAGRVRAVKGFGAKTEARLLEAIREHERRGERVLLVDALGAGERVVAYLKAHPSVADAAIAGEARRFHETVPRLRLVAAARTTPEAVADHFAAYPEIAKVLARDGAACEAQLADGLRVTLDAVAERDYALALLVATGSDDHVARVREAARRLGVRLDRARFSSEAEIYERLGMQAVPPELREGGGEVDAALAGTLPDDLVTLEDVRGLVHCHTVYSDGKNTILEMARAAEALGMEYLTITDHSPTAHYAGGVEVERLLRQWDEIEEAQEQVSVRLLRGTESDILADGSLDYPDEILERFDVIVASVHNRYKMDEDEMTRRIVRAMRHTVFKIWGHALGRLIESRPPFACRVEEILDAVAESRAAVEVNGDPHRLDMEPRWIREARKRKIRFVLSTDAHSVRGLENLRFAVGIARRGGLRRGEVLNTRPASAFARAVRPAA
jgi:DNA polymerase (family 10)